MRRDVAVLDDLGRALFSLPTGLTATRHTIFFGYSGDENFAASSLTLTFGSRQTSP